MDGVALAGHAENALGAAGQGHRPRAVGAAHAALRAAFIGGHADRRTKPRGNTFARGDGRHSFHFYWLECGLRQGFFGNFNHGWTRMDTDYFLIFFNSSDNCFRLPF
jgi:hypothetical protein